MESNLIGSEFHGFIVSQRLCCFISSSFIVAMDQSGGVGCSRISAAAHSLAREFEHDAPVGGDCMP
jgi:hypothetical protein